MSNNRKPQSKKLHEIHFELKYVPLPNGSGKKPRKVNRILAREVKARIPGDYFPLVSEPEFATDYSGRQTKDVIRWTVILHARNVELHRINLILVLREVLIAMREHWSAYAGGELNVVEGGMIVDLPGHYVSPCCVTGQAYPTRLDVPTTNQQTCHVIQRELARPLV